MDTDYLVALADLAFTLTVEAAVLFTLALVWRANRRAR
jgi:hypothetical protein